MNNKDLYNEVYTKNNTYNHNVEYKYEHVKRYFADRKKENPNLKIIDAGCGEGWNLKNLLNEGYDAFGVEISDVCCKKFLQDLPHTCCDIVDYAIGCGKKGLKYNALLSFDVMEHISHDDIDLTLNALTVLAPKALIGIAHHSDMQFGHELHLIQEDAVWWTNKLKTVYSIVDYVICLGGNFYLFECTV